MDRSSFTQATGVLLEVPRSDGGPPYEAFRPNPLPPEDERSILAAVPRLLSDASDAFGELRGIGRLLPDPNLLVQPYMRREAVLSSRIEGTRASFSDLVTFEVLDGPAPAGDAREVSNYVGALELGLRRAGDEGVTVDLIRDLHRRLLSGVRGETFGTPGEFRALQNHIGGSRDIADADFVPPPPSEVAPAIEALIQYVRSARPQTPVLVKAAWTHYQFETIHPFLDGNGRVGRLLIPLILATEGRLAHPLLYVSPYFERHRSEYYDRLFGVSARSEWAEWLRFFLEAVHDQARAAIDHAERVLALRVEWLARLDARRAPPSARRLADLVLEMPAVSARSVEVNLELQTAQSAYNAIRVLEDADILREVTGRARGRIWLADELVALMEA